jgi:hypothetical protein
VFTGDQWSFRGAKLQWQFDFNLALNAGYQSIGDYQLTQRHGRKTKVLRVKSASYNPSSDAVTLAVTGYKRGWSVQATITGLVGADGVAVAPFETGF